MFQTGVQLYLMPNYPPNHPLNPLAFVPFSAERAHPSEFVAIVVSVRPKG